MGVRDAIEAAIYTKLTTSAGTALWGSQVYYQEAPLKTVPPYVVFQDVAGGDMNIIPSRIVDVIYQAVCYTNDAVQATTGGEYIEAALRDVTLSVSGFNFMGCSQVGFISNPDTVEGRQYWGRGGEYRIRVSA
jgi:hypothetical protein